VVSKFFFRVHFVWLIFASGLFAGVISGTMLAIGGFAAGRVVGNIVGGNAI
jgi:hypothetical protein